MHCVTRGVASVLAYIPLILQVESILRGQLALIIQYCYNIIEHYHCILYNLNVMIIVL